MLRSNGTKAPWSTLAALQRPLREKHGLLPCLNTGSKTAFEQDFTAKTPLSHISIQATLIRTRLRSAFHIQQFSKSPSELFKIHMQNLHLTLELLDTLRHKQVFDSSVPTEVFKLTLTDAWTVIYLPLRCANTEVSSKQPSHGIINLQLITPANLTVTQPATILQHQTLRNTISKILRQNKQLTRMLPIQSLHMHNPTTTSMPNLNTLLKPQQSRPIHHLHTPK